MFLPTDGRWLHDHRTLVPLLCALHRDGIDDNVHNMVQHKLVESLRALRKIGWFSNAVLDKIFLEAP